MSGCIQSAKTTRKQSHWVVELTTVMRAGQRFHAGRELVRKLSESLGISHLPIRKCFPDRHLPPNTMRNQHYRLQRIAMRWSPIAVATGS